jgi:hypothetical protein
LAADSVPIVDLRIFTEPQQGATYDQLLRLARATEAADYDGFFCSGRGRRSSSAVRERAGLRSWRHGMPTT